MAKKKKKSTENKSNKKGSHPKYSKTTFEFGDKVYCSNCRKHVVVNAKSQDHSTFLKNHRSQCTATSSRKRVVAEEVLQIHQDPEESKQVEDLQLLDRDQAVISSGHTLLGIEEKSKGQSTGVLLRHRWTS